MALVVLLRGVNVGGHRRFRPSLLAGQLKRFDVVSFGATGTFVVRKPGPVGKFRAELLRNLPPGAVVALVDGRRFASLADEDPFGTAPRGDVVRFVSVLTRASRIRPELPITIPSKNDWLVQIVSADGPFVFGEYRRSMKTIGYLGEIDRLFGATATTRNWNTVMAIVKVLNGKSER